MVAGQLLSTGGVRVHVCMFAPGGERPWKGSLAKTSSCRAGSPIGLIKIQLRSNYFGKQWLRKFWLSPTSWCEMQKRRKLAPFGIDRSARTSEMPFPGAVPSDWFTHYVGWFLITYIAAWLKSVRSRLHTWLQLDVNFSHLTLKTCIELRGF